MAEGIKGASSDSPYSVDTSREGHLDHESLTSISSSALGFQGTERIIALHIAATRGLERDHEFVNALLDSYAGDPEQWNFDEFLAMGTTDVDTWEDIERRFDYTIEMLKDENDG